MDLGIRGRVALVLGAGGGLGRAIAVALAREARMWQARILTVVLERGEQERVIRPHPVESSTETPFYGGIVYEVMRLQFPPRRLCGASYGPPHGDRATLALHLSREVRFYRFGGLMRPSHKLLLFSSQEYSIISQSVRSVNTRLLVQGLV